MPLFFDGIKTYTYGFEAWRWTFFIPAGAFIAVSAVALMFTQDAPLGDYRCVPLLRCSSEWRDGRLVLSSPFASQYSLYRVSFRCSWIPGSWLLKGGVDA